MEDDIKVVDKATEVTGKTVLSFDKKYTKYLVI